MEKILRKLIREHLNSITISQSKESPLAEANIDEERISNPDAAEKVDNRENFVGSHTYGEDLGELGEMYVAYSYGQWYPLYVYYKNLWYVNTDDNISDGEVNLWTRKHKEDLRPNVETHGRSTEALIKMIDNFKDEHGIEHNSHSDIDVGEK